MSAPTRRHLAGAAVAAAAGAVLGTSATAAPFAAAWAVYQPYRHPSLSNGLGDEATDAWCVRQLVATGRLAEAPAGSLAELETKLAAAMVWFEENGAVALCGEEADLLRSCLRDLKALNRGQACPPDKALIDTLVSGHANLTAGALLVRNLAWMLEQKPKGSPPVAPEMLCFIADGMLDQLNTLEIAVERLQAAPGGEA